ncbi:MAG: hypothetical protein Q7J56_03285 [Deltaproteobacteria bacterium]|nr:hypothetical protein [Deltaproteobacteria bacterium]
MNFLCSGLKWTLIVLFVGGFALSVTNEGVKLLRARQNTQGTIVKGYALYERVLPTPRSMEKLVENWPFSKKRLGWDFVDFYQYNFECEFWRDRKQSNWENERRVKLKTRPKEKPVWQADELPVVRYECGPSPILYQPGQGWGLF